ncbi:nucleoside hydrolase [Marinoscillum furvescens]|uniref:Inosine-uridine nucleoside N-ribohydrolase n=1 Tax=Marinoscillum furvescens DSM 4134 TaxID=1122208 RepID=A0A3D9L6N9_MARFU|nr:nucleoside hydrolase [Marinoscillum furvescens]REE01541.1 inosine-uridine nucleoside N-ribohydrolase [Marinoscillum furvescens DSM 4134]
MPALVAKSLSLALLLAGCLFIPEHMEQSPPKIILDTDIGGDIDDLGALYALHVYADRGLCSIEAVMSSWSMEHHVSGIDAVNTYFGRGDLPVGAYKNEEPFAKEEYTWHLATNYPQDLSYDEAPDATSLYRQLLASSADTSITIVVTGRLSNLYYLFKSTADEHSDLSGLELVGQKVKACYIMGGRYPGDGGKEANFHWGGPGVSQYVIANCPRPMIFNGGKIGHINEGYGTGSRINELPASHLLRSGYQYFFTNPPDWTGMESSAKVEPWSIWDIITVQLAVTGVADYFTVVDQGYNEVDQVGVNYWRSEPDKEHSYVVPKMDPQQYAREVIEPLLLTTPQHQRK